MFIITTHNVPKQSAKSRLSDYALAIFNKYIPSRKGIKKALKRGEIYVDGKRGNSGDWVEEGQKIELRDLEQNPPEPYHIDFEIVFEDPYFAIINKPAGISVSGNQYNTIQNALIGTIKKSDEADALKWARPVHRLDNQTSGLLVIAKTASAHMHLSKQFEEKTIQKKYHAIVMGEPELGGEITFSIDNKEAKTTYKTLKTIPSLQSGKLSWVELLPHTGRTHQLRIHCSKLQFPILGDKLYGPKGNILLHKGLFLAAIELSLHHPKSNEKIEIKIDTPSKFNNTWEREQKRWEKFNPV